MFPMSRYRPAKSTILFPFQPVRILLLIFPGRVIPSLALGACEGNNFLHRDPTLACLLIMPVDRRTSYGDVNALRSDELACQTWFKKSRKACYSIISVTTPAPTVLPPSRIAKRNSFSIATGVIKSALMETLSPGITISVPSGNSTIPVTSVVRK